MKTFQKAVSALLILGALSAAPVASSQAGIIFAPAGVGIFLLIVGLINNDPVLIILDADGNANQDSLTAALDAKFPRINDREVTTALAAKIRAKAVSTQANAKGEKNVSLTRAEVSEILAPTGLEESNVDSFNQIVAALQ